MISLQRVTVALLLAVVVMVPLVRTQKAGQADPRQRKIAFDSNRGGNREVYVMDADGSNVRQLTKDDKPASRPYWSPDGKNVVFVSPTGNSKDWRDHGLYVMDADGSNVRSLSISKAGDSHPA